MYQTTYYLRAKKDYQSLAYPPRLAVDLGTYVDGVRPTGPRWVGSVAIWLL